MRVLVRHITQKARSGVGHSDHEVDGDSLTIGRGSKDDVFLSDLHVALHHAMLRPVSNGRFSIQARTPSGVKVNGRTVQTSVVRPGDTLEIGLSTLRLRRPDADHDLVMEVEETRTQPGEAAQAGPTTLAAAGLRRRRWAWALFVAILALGLGVPFGHMVRENLGSDDGMTAGDGTAGGDGSRNPPLSHRLVETV